MFRRSPILFPGYEAAGFQGIGAPAGTPEEILDKLHTSGQRGTRDADVQSPPCRPRRAVFSSSRAEFKALIAGDTEKWAKVVKFADIKAAE